MKIAFLNLFSGIVERGVETLIEEVSPRLSKKNELVVFQGGEGRSKDYEIRQVSTDWKPEILEQPLNLKHRLFLDKTSLAIRKFTTVILPALKKEKFDIVVPWNNGWQTLLCKVSSVGKIVVVGQSGLGWVDRVNLWLFPHVFVGFTDFQCNWAKRINPFVKVKKIPNGVDRKIFSTQGKKLNLGLPGPIILIVGALVPLKRHHLAIQAVAKLDKGSLVFLGKGELKANLQKLGDELLPGRFKIIETTKERIPDVYRSADLFTFPTSSWESFGIVLLEAMATNLPVVANDDPIRREIVGDAGFFVDPLDVDAYAAVIKKALETKWGDKPRKQAEKFSWDKIAGQYEKLFKELI